MSNPKWTDEQKLAIEKNGNNILVAAAAGSGKTAVLVERIIQKIIKDGIDIDRLLVVTFTNAAAAEMRERILESIYKELDVNPDDEHLKKQIILLGKANICTIHSFCLDVIRNYFYEIDLPANFKISSDEEIAILKQETLEDVLDDLYEAEDEHFMRLVDCYASYKDDEKIRSLINTIYSFIQSNPFPMEWLEEKVQKFKKTEDKKDFSECDFGKILLKDLSDKVYDAVCNYKVLQKKVEKYPEYPVMLDTIVSEIDLLKAFYDKLQVGWDEAYSFKGPKKLEFPKWKADKDGSKDLIDSIKSSRDNIKEHIRDEIEKVLKYSSNAAFEDIYEMYDVLNSLRIVIEKFDVEFKKRKKDKNILDFSDIEHYALKILVTKNEDGVYIPTDVAKKYQEKFVEIAIDEYQDSNQIQEYILTKISKGDNIFMVGDVKQSIYRFRQSRPDLFMEKYNTYGENIIQLFKNFRSRKNILDFTNTIFENIMSVEFGELDYSKKEYLNYGMEDYPEDDNSYSNFDKAKIELILIETKDQEQEIDIYKDSEEDDDDEQYEQEDVLQIYEKEELEANYVSQKIDEIIESKIKIYDKNIKELREVKYKDIVILLRQTATVAPIFEKVLAKNGIPVYSDANSEYLDTYEIQTVLNVLRIIDNPLDDIALVSTLRGEIGEFTDNELVEIRLCDKDKNFYDALIKAKDEVQGDLSIKVNSFINQLEDWKIKAKYLSLAELIWDIYTVTGFYNYVSLMPNGTVRKNNLKKLFERAKDFENSSFKGLFDFIRFLQRIKTGNSDLSPAKLIGENENVVRIMSIHKSKGLEFPIVFLSNVGKQFNEMDLRQEVLLHEKYGLGPQYINTEMGITYSTSSKDAIKIINKKEAMSEEMRVLYVALTRAREKLYISGTSKNIAKDMSKKKDLLEIYGKKNGKLNPILLQKAKSYLDWILQVVQSKVLDDNIDVRIIDKNDVVKNEVDEGDNLRKFDFSNSINTEEIAKELNFEYDNYIATILPLKSTVSKIKEMNDEDSVYDFTTSDQVVIDFSKLDETEEQKIFIKNEVDFENNKPTFMQGNQELTGAQKGTVMHYVLQKLDFSKEYTINDLKEFVNNLVNNNCLSKEQVGTLRLDKIQKFLESSIGKELLNAKCIIKEKPFVTKILANEIFECTKTDDYVLVQGIIDLFYQNAQDEWILLDYKTDFIPDGDISILKKKYHKQLEIYKKALEEVLGRTVSHTYIYSLNLNEKVEL